MSDVTNEVTASIIPAVQTIGEVTGSFIVSESQKLLIMRANLEDFVSEVRQMKGRVSITALQMYFFESTLKAFAKSDDSWGRSDVTMANRIVNMAKKSLDDAVARSVDARNFKIADLKRNANYINYGIETETVIKPQNRGEYIVVSVQDVRRYGFSTDVRVEPRFAVVDGVASMMFHVDTRTFDSADDENIIANLDDAIVRAVEVAAERVEARVQHMRDEAQFAIDALNAEGIEFELDADYCK